MDCPSEVLPVPGGPTKLSNDDHEDDGRAGNSRYHSQQNRAFDYLSYRPVGWSSYSGNRCLGIIALRYQSELRLLYLLQLLDFALSLQSFQSDDRKVLDQALLDLLETEVV